MQQILATSPLSTGENNIIDFNTATQKKSLESVLSPVLTDSTQRAILQLEAQTKYTMVQDNMRVINIALHQVLDHLRTLPPSLEVSALIRDTQKKIFQNAFYPSIPGHLQEVYHMIEELDSNSQ